MKQGTLKGIEIARVLEDKAEPKSKSEIKYTALILE